MIPLLDTCHNMKTPNIKVKYFPHFQTGKFVFSFPLIILFLHFHYTFLCYSKVCILLVTLKLNFGVLLTTHGVQTFITLFITSINLLLSYPCNFETCWTSVHYYVCYFWVYFNLHTIIVDFVILFFYCVQTC
jgi:hypothetical protein